MKTTLVNISLLACIALSLQSCFFGWDGNGSQGPYGYSVLNTNKFLAERDYKKEMPFSFRDEGLNCPMISNKNQMNFAVNFIHGPSLSYTAAISNKMFLEFGFHA